MERRNAVIPRTVNTMRYDPEVDLGRLLASQRKRTQAIQLLQAEIASSPVAHPDAMEAQQHLAQILIEVGQFEEAEKLYRDLLMQHQKILGRQHPASLRLLCHLANTLHEQHELDDAESLLKEALTAYQELFDLTQQASLSCLTDLSTLWASPYSWWFHEKPGQKETAKIYLSHASSVAEWQWDDVTDVYPNAVCKADDRFWYSYSFIGCLQSIDPQKAFEMCHVLCTRVEEEKQPKWQIRLYKNRRDGIKKNLCKQVLSRLWSAFGIFLDLLMAYLICAFNVLNLQPSQSNQTPSWLALATAGEVSEEVNLNELGELGCSGMTMCCTFFAIVDIFAQLWQCVYLRVVNAEMGRWGFAYRCELEAWKSAWLRYESFAVLVYTVHTLAFMIGAASHGEVILSSCTWTTFFCWFCWELSLRCMEILFRVHPLSVCLVSVLVSVVRTTALHFHLDKVRQISSWAEVPWTSIWLLYFFSSTFLMPLKESVPFLVRVVMEGRTVEMLCRLLGTQNFQKDKLEEEASRSGAGRASRKATPVVKHAATLLWCVAFTALWSIDGLCWGDYVVSGATGAGRLGNGDYSYAGEYNGRPSYGQMGGGRGHIRMNDEQRWGLRVGSGVYWGPKEFQPPVGRWINPSCEECSGLPPRVDSCESGCDFMVTGAGGKGLGCNGNYTYAGEKNNRPFYRHANGHAEIYFQSTWKLTTRAVQQELDPGFTLDYLYEPPVSQQLPTGQWITDGGCGSNADPAPTVTMCEGCDVDYIVTGAGGVGSSCNGNYSLFRADSLEFSQVYGRGKSFYRKTSGEGWISLDSIGRWKMRCRNSSFSPQAMDVWHYAEPKKLTPPTGQWASAKPCHCSYSGAVVSRCSECSEKTYVVSELAHPHDRANGEYHFSTEKNGRPHFEKTSGDAHLEFSDGGRWMLKLEMDAAESISVPQVYFGPGQGKLPLGPWKWVGSNATEEHNAIMSECSSGISRVFVLVAMLLAFATSIYTCYIIRRIKRMEVGIESEEQPTDVRICVGR